jgi:hypothetical protein
VLKLRAQIASFRFAQGSRILIIMIGINRAERVAAASGITAMPTPAATYLPHLHNNNCRSQSPLPLRCAWGVPG